MNNWRDEIAMFIARNKVRMHDTDMGGILFFGNQFRFVHDALEDFMAKEGLYFHHLFTANHFTFVVVHAEADYKAPVSVGDDLEIYVWVERLGTSSFTIAYEIFATPFTEASKENSERFFVGSAKTVHVTLDTATRTKIPIPEILRGSFLKYMKLN